MRTIHLPYICRHISLVQFRQGISQAEVPQGLPSMMAVINLVARKNDSLQLGGRLAHVDVPMET